MKSATHYTVQPYLEAHEHKEEAMIKKPNDGPQSTRQTLLNAVTMILDCSEVQTAGKVQRQRYTEDQHLSITSTSNNHIATWHSAEAAAAATTTSTNSSVDQFIFF